MKKIAEILTAIGAVTEIISFPVAVFFPTMMTVAIISVIVNTIGCLMDAYYRGVEKTEKKF